MGYGVSVPKGSLPVYSVADADEARLLLASTCQMGYDGHYYARELGEEQTLENLERFSDRLHAAHVRMVERGKCRCKEVVRK